MRLALLSDIHANLEAFTACMAHARAQGATRFAVLGDLVGYGADPEAVVQAIAQLQHEGAFVVKGNHDEAVAQARGYFNANAAEAMEWTRGRLGKAERDFLQSLPLCVREGPCCFVHASAASPERWDYVDSPRAAARSAEAAQAPFTFSGHVHHQVFFVSGAHNGMVPFIPRPGVPIPLRSHRKCVSLVGSVGQPRDGNPAAAYAIADLERHTVCFHRVAYDHLAAARKVRAAGLPEALAYRLERGA